MQSASDQLSYLWNPPIRTLPLEPFVISILPWMLGEGVTVTTWFVPKIGCEVDTCIVFPSSHLSNRIGRHIVGANIAKDRYTMSLGPCMVSWAASGDLPSCDERLQTTDPMTTGVIATRTTRAGLRIWRHDTRCHFLRLTITPILPGKVE